jgi:hypothetical protein
LIITCSSHAGSRLERGANGTGTDRSVRVFMCSSGRRSLSFLHRERVRRCKTTRTGLRETSRDPFRVTISRENACSGGRETPGKIAEPPEYARSRGILGSREKPTWRGPTRRWFIRVGSRKGERRGALRRRVGCAIAVDSPELLRPPL